MSSGRACVRTAIVVPSGTRSSSITSRTKSKSVFDAEGKPTSISGIPSARSSSKNRCLRAWSIGLTRAWLPSRRSVEHQIGARSTTRSGQVRSGRSTVAYGRYFQCGMVIGAGSFGVGCGRTTGAARNVYVDASLPLAGKEEQARAETRAAWRNGVAVADHGATIAELSCARGPESARADTGPREDP